MQHIRQRGSDLADSTDIPSGGILIVGSPARNSTGDITLTGVTQDGAGNLLSNAFLWGYGSNENLPSQGGRTITSDGGPGSDTANALVSVSWQ